MSPSVPWTNHARQMCLSAALLSSEWNQVSAPAQQHWAQDSLSMCGVEWFSGQGRASSLSAHCCSFALGIGLLGILQHNAINTEQPLIDQRKDGSSAGTKAALQVCPVARISSSLNKALHAFSFSPPTTVTSPQLHPTQRRSPTLTDTHPRHI